MESILDLLHRHPDFDPSSGTDIPSNDEVWAANTATFFDLVKLGVLSDTVEDGIIVRTKEEKWASIRERYGSSGRLTPEDESRMVEVNHQRLVARMAKAGIPAMYFNVIADERWNEALDSGRGAYFHGASGVGKTTAACSIMKGWMNAHIYGDPLFVTAEQLMSEVSSTYGTQRTQEDVMLRYIECPLLVIDDLDKPEWNGRSIPRLWRVINDRCVSLRPTIITTQLPPSGMLAGFGDEYATSIGSRIKGSYEIRELLGVDMRIS